MDLSCLRCGRELAKRTASGLCFDCLRSCPNCGKGKNRKAILCLTCSYAKGRGVALLSEKRCSECSGPVAFGNTSGLCNTCRSTCKCGRPKSRKAPHCRVCSETLLPLRLRVLKRRKRCRSCRKMRNLWKDRVCRGCHQICPGCKKKKDSRSVLCRYCRHFETRRRPPVKVPCTICRGKLGSCNTTGICGKCQATCPYCGGKKVHSSIRCRNCLSGRSRCLEEWEECPVNWPPSLPHRHCFFCGEPCAHYVDACGRHALLHLSEEMPLSVAI